MFKLATSKISIFYLVSVAEETGLSLAFVRNPEDRFCRVEAHIRDDTYVSASEERVKASLTTLADLWVKLQIFKILNFRNSNF